MWLALQPIIRLHNGKCSNHCFCRRIYLFFMNVLRTVCRHLSHGFNGPCGPKGWRPSLQRVWVLLALPTRAVRRCCYTLCAFKVVVPAITVVSRPPRRNVGLLRTAKVLFLRDTALVSRKLGSAFQVAPFPNSTKIHGIRRSPHRPFTEISCLGIYGVLLIIVYYYYYRHNHL